MQIMHRCWQQHHTNLLMQHMPSTWQRREEEKMKIRGDIKRLNRGKTAASTFYNINKRIAQFLFPCSWHGPSFLQFGAKQEERIHFISDFVHHSDSILSFSQISRDAHMAQKQSKSGTEKNKHYTQQWENGNSSETNRCLRLIILEFVILSQWHFQYGNNNSITQSVWITFIFSISKICSLTKHIW